MPPMCRMLAALAWRLVLPPLSLHSCRHAVRPHVASPAVRPRGAAPTATPDPEAVPAPASSARRTPPADRVPPPSRIADEAYQTLRLSPTNLQLPQPAPDAPANVRQFYTAATRAIRHTYEDDVDDTSLLQALTAHLRAQGTLSALQPVWLQALLTAQRRAATLRFLGPTLRALRQALANAWRDELTRTTRDVDLQACRVALDQVPAEPGDRDTPLQETVVTIEPFGTYPLSAFLRFCQHPRALWEMP